MELTVGHGFKQTEIGSIPVDWQLFSIGDLFSFEGGSQPPRESFIFHEREGYVRLIQIRDYKSDKYASYIPKGLARRWCNSDDIMIGRYGPPIFQILKGISGAYNVALIKANPTQKVHPKYGWFILKQEKLFEFVEKLSQRSSGQTGVDLVELRKYLIPLPTKEEQTAIATALSDADALIAGLEKLIEKKRLIKQGAMQELLRPKEGWEVKKLGEIAQITMGQSPLSEYYNKDGVGLPLIQGNADIRNRKTIIRAYTSVVTKKGKSGDTIMSVRAPVGEVAKATFDCCLGRGVCAISFPNDYVYYYLIYYEQSWSKYSTGSTFDSVNSKQVKELEIPIPAKPEEQVAISSVLHDMDKEIESLEHKLSKQKVIKQGMMQMLLTGKLRLVATHDTNRTIELTPERIKQKTGHNVQFNEAVLISVLTERYGSVKYPLGRFRYTKFLYLFHRYVEGAANGFLKKAAGPYNPSNRYGGPEAIAIKSKYVQVEGKGFVACDNIDEAKRYFDNWYHDDALAWLDKFRFYKNDQLELLTTVDMAVDDLRKAGKDISVASVKAVIAGNKEWKPKLEKDFFNDVAIAGAIKESADLFG